MADCKLAAVYPKGLDVSMRIMSWWFIAGVVALMIVTLLQVPPAQAQGMNQTRIINQAINNQSRLAFRPRLVVRDSAGPVDAIDLDSSQRYLAAASRDGLVRMWDLQSGKQVGRVKAGPVRALAIQTGSRVAAIGTGTGDVIIHDMGTGLEIRRFSGHQGMVLAARLSPDGSILATGGADGTIRLWDMTNGVPIATLDGQAGPVAALAFDVSGRTLASGIGRTVRLWPVAGGPPMIMEDADAEVRALIFAADSTLTAALSDGMVQSWQPGNSRKMRGRPGLDGTPSTLAIGKNGTLLLAGDGGAVLLGRSGRRLATIPVGTMAVFAPGADRVLVADRDGRLLLWDSESERRLAQLLITRRGWAIVDAQGRHDGSGPGLLDMSWQTDTEIFEMVNFSEPYYEPGLLAKLLLAPDALLTPDVPTIGDGIAPPPLVRLSIAGAPPTVPGPGRIIVTAQDRGGSISRITLYHNGKALTDRHVADTRDTVENGAAIRTVTYNIDLISGDNHLRAVAAASNLVDSVPAETTITVGGPTLSAEKPALHMVVIGINQYANPLLTLNYAVDDARGLTNWAQQNAKGLFSEIQLHPLYDKAATKRAISDLFGKLQSTRPQDIVVIYLAGHGENSDGSWFFLPTEFGEGLSFPDSNMDRRNIAALRGNLRQAVVTSGLAAHTIQQAVGQIGAQRIVLLIDACKSGSVRDLFEGDADIKSLQMLSKQAGIHLLAATEQDQFAVEVKELKHGVFTYIMLKALTGEADIPPSDGMVSAVELLYYTAEEVPSMAFNKAKSAQFPTIYSRGVDFPLGISSRWER